MEVRLNREWGNICNDNYYSEYEADVICHQLGYTGASSYDSAGFLRYSAAIRFKWIYFCVLLVMVLIRNQLYLIMSIVDEETILLFYSVLLLPLLLINDVLIQTSMMPLYLAVSHHPHYNSNTFL